jgi:transposase
MLAIALVLEGKDRKTAAETCGMDRQTLRDWVHRTTRPPSPQSHSATGQRSSLRAVGISIMANVSRRLFLQGAGTFAWATAGVGSAVAFEPALRSLLITSAQ